VIIYLLLQTKATGFTSQRMHQRPEEIDILDKHGTQRENSGEARYAKLSSKLTSNSVSGS
jgi:hypothetical protein